MRDLADLRLDIHMLRIVIDRLTALIRDDDVHYALSLRSIDPLVVT